MSTLQAPSEGVTQEGGFNSHPQCVNACLEVVGDSVRLHKSMVGDRAKFVVLATKLLLQLQCLLEAGDSRARLGAGVE